VIVLDDGFQNPTIHKDLSLVLIDATAGLGNGRVFPAGPLRENARSALARADAVILVSPAGADVDRRTAWRHYMREGAPIIDVEIVPEGHGPAGPVFAFAGIARPQKFFDSLHRWGAEVKATMSFPDHHPFSAAELTSLREAARRHNALLLTTEKDHMRLPRDMRKLVHTWPVAARFKDTHALDNLIERAVDRAAKR
jgi:tetraacyldisaccharide 4'-kinase